MYKPIFQQFVSTSRGDLEEAIGQFLERTWSIDPKAQVISHNSYTTVYPSVKNAQEPFEIEYGESFVILTMG